MSYPFDCISDLIFVETPIEPADIILVPGGSHPQLMKRAAELYHQGLAPLILPSGGPNPKLPQFESEWEFLKTLAVQMNVPEEVILKENRAKDTFENAQFSWNVLREKEISVHKAVLVCKAYHSRRALLTYQTFFPAEVTFFVSPVIDNRGISRESWFLNSEHTRIVMGEVAKIGQYFAGQVPVWVKGMQAQVVEAALGWAMDHLGGTSYAGLCYAFCEDAYELGANIILDGQGRTAREAATAYDARMQAAGLHCEGLPPRGAYVFYNCAGPLKGEYRDWGHMGLSLGDGRVIHAWGSVRIDELRAVEELTPLSGWTKNTYTGWAPPEITLQGMRLK